MTIDLTQIVVSIISLVLTALIGWATRVIVPKVDAWLDAKTTHAQREEIWKIVQTLVEAAQQLYINNADKLNYVQSELEARGIKIDRAMVESAVYEMKTIAVMTAHDCITEEEEVNE